jgi:hypothetical protein
MCLKNLATNTLIPTVLRPLQEPAVRLSGQPAGCPASPPAPASPKTLRPGRRSGTCARTRCKGPNTRLINVDHQHRLAPLWGGETLSPCDEQRFALRGGSLFTRALSPYFLDETTTT